MEVFFKKNIDISISRLFKNHIIFTTNKELIERQAINC